MKHINYMTLSLLTLCTSHIHTEVYKPEKQETVHVELSRSVILKRHALVKEIEQICIDFFKSKNRKALDDFRYDEAATIKNINGTPEEVEMVFKKMYLSHAQARAEIVTLHYALEKIEAQLIKTGLSRTEVYLVSIDTMDRISTAHRDAEKLQSLQENIKKQDPSSWEQETQYALSLLYQLEKGEYESEGHRLVLAMNARKLLERTYIRKKYAVQ